MKTIELSIVYKQERNIGDYDIHSTLNSRDREESHQ